MDLTILWCFIAFWVFGWIGSFLLGRPATYGVRTILLLIWLAFLWPLAIGIWIKAGVDEEIL